MLRLGAQGRTRFSPWTCPLPLLPLLPLPCGPACAATLTKLEDGVLLSVSPAQLHISAPLPYPATLMAACEHNVHSVLLGTLWIREQRLAWHAMLAV